ncbi:MAG: PIN domain-containing protein [Lachnospiraceae bacterium]|nr:PIN domain-containing protein [Lachnospiraceae bacterium]
MILLDTNIIIDYWKYPNDKKKDFLKNNKCCICGIVIAELLRGARSDKDSQRIRTALQSFENVSFREEFWPELGDMLYNLKGNGFTMPIQDVIIALLAMRYNLSVATYDVHYKHIQEVYPILQLSEVPEKG